MASTSLSSRLHTETMNWDGELSDFFAEAAAAARDLGSQLQAAHKDLRALADAVLNAKSTLENDLYRTRVKNAHDYLEEANATALNWMSEPRDG